jgi:hypothetical protein
MLHATSLQGFGYGDIVHQFEKRCNIHFSDFDWRCNYYYSNPILLVTKILLLFRKQATGNS